MSNTRLDNIPQDSAPQPITHTLSTISPLTHHGHPNGQKTDRYGLAMDSRSAHIHELGTD